MCDLFYHRKLHNLTKCNWSWEYLLMHVNYLHQQVLLNATSLLALNSFPKQKLILKLIPNPKS